MVYMWYIIPLLLAPVALGDYYIDNANTSVTYSMPPSLSRSWQVFSSLAISQVLVVANSTGNYNITLDSSDCYDQNYAQGVCNTNDNCFVQIPFRGSGITIYVFNAGGSGMTAGFSVDGGVPVSSSVAGPTAAQNYQVSNVSLYDIQGLPTADHSIQMTILDSNGSATSLKFDYARVNETFVATPTTTSSSSLLSTPTLTSTSTSTTSVSASFVSTQTLTQGPKKILPASNRINLGSVIGGTLGGAAVLGGILTGIFCFRRRRAPPRESTASTFQVQPFTSDYHSQAHTQRGLSFPEGNSAIFPLKRSTLLRGALATALESSSESTQRSQSFTSVLQPLRRQPSHSFESDPHVRSSMSRLAHAGSLPILDPAMESQYNLTAEQVEVIHRLRAGNVPVDTVARVVEGFVLSQFSTSGTDSRRETHIGSVSSSAPPPSYQTRVR